MSPWDIGKNENSCQNPSFLLFSWEIVLTYTHTMLLQYSNIKNRSSIETTNLIFSCPGVTHCTNPARIPHMAAAGNEKAGAGNEKAGNSNNTPRVMSLP